MLLNCFNKTITIHTYNLFKLKLYGHNQISLLNGALPTWLKHVTNKSTDQFIPTIQAYKIESGSSSFVEKLGDFRASWNFDFISTFDDVFANFEKHYKADIVDVQTFEVFFYILNFFNLIKEYKGIAKGDVIFGHIRSAINIPSETLYNWTNDSWLTIQETKELFESKGLSPQKPIILYDATSLHSTMAWFSIYRLNKTYKVSIYFGSWSEWIIRAPDYLKVIPNGE